MDHVRFSNRGHNLDTGNLIQVLGTYFRYIDSGTRHNFGTGDLIQVLGTYFRHRDSGKRHNLATGDMNQVHEYSVSGIGAVLYRKLFHIFYHIFI